MRTVERSGDVEALGTCDILHARLADPAMCDQVADHLIKIMPTRFEGMSAERAREARAKLEKQLDKTRLVEQCMEMRISRAQFDCVNRTAHWNQLDRCTWTQE